MQRTLIAVFVSVVILGLTAGLPAQNTGKEAPKVPLSKETQACLECHEEAAGQVMQTVHWTWEAEAVPMAGRAEPVAHGKKNAINNF
jgi:hypothetical protein